MYLNPFRGIGKRRRTSIHRSTKNIFTLDQNQISRFTKFFSTKFLVKEGFKSGLDSLEQKEVAEPSASEYAFISSRDGMPD